MAQKIDALLILPGEAPRQIEIEDTLASYQKLVGGYIEMVTMEENVCLLMNEEGKLLGLEPNRRMGEDILVGSVLVVGTTPAGDFASLTPAQSKAYAEQYAQPETFDTAEQIDLLRFTM